MFRGLTPWRVLAIGLALLGAGCLGLILTMPRPPAGGPGDRVLAVVQDAVTSGLTGAEDVEQLEGAARALVGAGAAVRIRVSVEGVELVDVSQAPGPGLRGQAPTARTVTTDGREYRVEVVSAEPADLAGLRWRRELLQVLTVTLVAVSAGGLVVSRRRHAQQERISLLDPLTGVGNRRQLDRLAARLLHDPGEGRRCALLLLDLDGFKQVNDRHGHARGDELLRQFAGAVQDAVRPGDHVIRLGGDEFAVLLELGYEPATGVDSSVAAVFTRVRDLLPDVGVSGGSAVWPDDASDLAGLQDYADRAMYRDKQRRRGSTTPVR